MLGKEPSIYWCGKTRYSLMREHLVTACNAQVSSVLLGKEPSIYRCGKTRYSFMWRQAEMRALFERGFKLEEVEMLADHSMRFMYICRAASQVCASMHVCGQTTTCVSWIIASHVGAIMYVYLHYL